MREAMCWTFMFFCLYLVEARMVDWSYTNPTTDPLTWPGLANTMCSGYMQSPIALNYSESVYQPFLKPIFIFLRPGLTLNHIGMYNVTNHGRGLLLRFPPNTWYISFDGTTSQNYEVIQLHFHWGSSDDVGGEHPIDGRTFALELRIVSYRREMYSTIREAVRSPGGLAVLGVPHVVNDDVDSRETSIGLMGDLLKHLTPELTPGSYRLLPAFDLSMFIDSLNAGEYFRYFGSVTAPPCTENVVWSVVNNPAYVRSDQLQSFRSLFYGPTERETNMMNNFRPVQPTKSQRALVNREVFRSWNTACSSRLLFPNLLLLVLFTLVLRKHV